MDFTVDFYERADGSKPMDTFLHTLADKRPVLHKLVVAALVKLRTRQYHKPPLTEMVDSQHDIFEVRVGHKDIARAFFFFSKGQRIIVTNGYVKHTQKVDQRELKSAVRFKQDWEAQNP